MYIELNKADINSKLIELKGIYFVYSLVLDSRIVYIGCSKNIYKRFKEHKYQKEFDSIEMFSMPGHREAKIKERELIFIHKPELNANAKDNQCAVIFSEYNDKSKPTPIEELKQIHSILNR